MTALGNRYDRPVLDLAEIRRLFPDLDGTTYLNTANMCVGCAPATEAYQGALTRWGRGRFDWTEAERAGEEARASFAAIVGAEAEDVALLPAVSAAAGLVAANLPPAGPGANVVVAGHEFSSNYFPWLLLRERGYKVRTLATSGEGPGAEAFAAAVDGATRLLAVSAVQSSTGYRADLAALREIADRSGAWMFVDACQAAGAVPLDVVRDGVDFLASAAHKFLLGSRGMGYLYVRRPLREGLRPVFPGWKAARRPTESFYGPSMDLSPTASKLDGSLPWFAALADRAALGVFAQLGLGAVLERNARLSRRLHEGVAARWPGVARTPERHRSTILAVPVADPEVAMARLREAAVVASMRAGAIRLSVHFYNREEDVDRALDVLAEV